jgi:hypothetical protein
VSSEDCNEDVGYGESRPTTPRVAVSGLIKRLSIRGSKFLGIGDTEYDEMSGLREENVACGPGSAETERLARVESAAADEQTNLTEMEM